jgi:hypothetical protein
VNPRILITCSRSWSRWSEVRRVLTEIHGRHPDAVLVHGDAPQGDRQVAGIWRDLGGVVEPHPADWTRYGRAAGFRRNAAMVESLGGHAHLVLAFIKNHSKGARHAYDLAKGAGLNCLLYEHNDEEES